MDGGIIRELASRMDRVAGQLDQLIGSVEGTVRNASATWFGADQERFYQDWNRSHRPLLMSLRADIQSLAMTARTNADQQDAASAAEAPSTSRGAGGAPLVTLGGEPVNFGLPDWIGPLLAAAGIGMTLTKLAELSAKYGISLAQWEPGVLNMLDDGGKLARSWGVVSLVGVATDGAGMVRDIIDGADPWKVGSDALGVAIDGVGVIFPEVGLAKGAWDVGYYIGDHYVAQIPAVQHAMNSLDNGALQVGARAVHGDIQTDPAAANRLVQRYSGVGGFFNWAHDSAVSLL